MSLRVEDLKVYYRMKRGDVQAVEKISFHIKKGEAVGLVGESGCGKSTVAFSLLRMLPFPGEIMDGSSIFLDDVNLVSLEEDEMRDLRWSKISMVFQGAMNSLNPVMRIREQIADVIRTHDGTLAKPELKERIAELLHVVGLPSRVGALYPHELSGGMKQRVCIAMSIALQPTLVVADEPTSALDVIVQRVVAQTLLDIREKFGMSILIIGHDISLIAQLVDRIAVMYAGNLVEVSPLDKIVDEPLHPYTKLLIDSIPSITEKKPMRFSSGITHDLRNPPPGCVFQSRCDQVMDVCRKVIPPLLEIEPGLQVACHLYGNDE